MKLPALPCNVTLMPDLGLPTKEPTHMPVVLGLFKKLAPDTSFALAADGMMIGYAALIPYTPGYCEVVLYVSPVARNLGEGLRSVALALGRGGIQLARNLGFKAMAARAESLGSLRLARLLGGEESGLELDYDGYAMEGQFVDIIPVLIWRFVHESLDSREIARRCMPKHHIELTNNVDHVEAATAGFSGGLAFRPLIEWSGRVQKENGQTFLIRPSAVAR
jgi:hypothetical protein